MHKLLILISALWSAPLLAEDSVTVGFQGLSPSLGNPYSGSGAFSAYPWSAIFDGLTFVADDGTAEAALATSWERVDDLTWEFKIRDGVLFHDGTPLTAADVVFSVNQLTGKNGVFERAGIAFGGLDSTELVDAETVRFTMSDPDPLFPRRASLIYVVPEAAWTGLGRDQFTQAPIGTGPFRVEDFSLSGATLTAHAEGWRAPKLASMDWQVIPDRASRVQGMLAGSLDIALGMSPEDIGFLENAGMNIFITGGGSVTGISFIATRGGPVADPRVRRALNHAVNRTILFDVLLEGVAPAATQIAPRIAFGYNPDLKPYAYDPELARALLAEAGYPDGFSFVMEATVGAQLADTAIYQQVASDLAKIGVQMEVRSVPIQRLIGNVNGGTWGGQAFVINFGSEPTMDALRPLRFHSCLKEPAWACTEALMPQINDAFAEGDLAVREEKTKAVMEAIWNDAPAILLNEVVRIVAASSKVEGFSEAHANIAYQSLEVVD